MGGNFADSLLAPALVIAVLGWCVPLSLGRILPEGVKPLMWNALFSAIILYALSACFFLVLFMFKGSTISDLGRFGLVDNVLFFGRLGLISAIIWAPLMVLSIANLPRRWTKETW